MTVHGSTLKMNTGMGNGLSTGMGDGLVRDDRSAGFWRQNF